MTFRLATLGLSTALALVVGAKIGWTREPQEPKASAPPAKAEAPQEPATQEQVILEELRAQAKEDLAIWEARVTARKSWVAEADKHRAITKAFRDLNEKQVQQGTVPPNELNQLSVQTAEMEARLNQKKLELVEAEARTTRLRRRVALLEKADRYAMLRPGFTAVLERNDAGTVTGERVSDIELQLERVRAELDEVLKSSRLFMNNSRRSR